MPALRPYQVDAINALRQQVIAGNRRLILYMPTGGGKTIVASEIIRLAYEKGNPSLFLCHRRELVFQASNKLHDIGLPHGVILAGEEGNDRDIIQVASLQTLHTRALRRESIEPPPASLIIFDEAHHATATSYMDVLKLYPNAVVIGLTATPIRKDGRGLGTFFNEIVSAPSISQLIEMGYLVPPEHYAPVKLDLSRVKVVAGDYNNAELELAMDKPKLVGDVVEHIDRLAKNRKIIVFAAGVAHSRHIAELLADAGFSVAHVDGKTPKDQRDTIFRDFHKGRLQIVTNCQIATEGVDIPSMSAIVLARPTKSLGLYIQMVGRGLRTFDGKKDCLVLDHAGCYYEHGPITQEFDWFLDDKKKMNRDTKKVAERQTSGVVCPNPACGYVFSRSPVCPRCGTPLPEPKGKAVQSVDGLLAKVEKNGVMVKERYTTEDKRRFYQGLLAIAQQRSYSRGWAAHTYREKFGKWPDEFRGASPIPPSPEVLSYVRHKMIRYAKRKVKGKVAS